MCLMKLSLSLWVQRKSNQPSLTLDSLKLVFVEIHASSLRPEVLDPREPGNKLLVAGPKDIKSRSTGTIRIGDRIHAVATRYALCEPSKEGGANAQGGVSLSSVSGGPIVRGPTAVLFEEICDRAQAEGSLIAIAAIRESTNMVYIDMSKTIIYAFVFKHFFVLASNYSAVSDE
uniref:RNase_PH domain-containing protein n=1 Tax=Heterorhabditis bacteriophora TaxID=37862 RepID=A0A1I7WX97_HETBA